MRFPLCFSWITEFNVHDQRRDKLLCGVFMLSGFTNKKQKIEGFAHYGALHQIFTDYKSWIFFYNHAVIGSVY